MSVITQQIGKDQYDLYMKGAPEMVTNFCRPETGMDMYIYLAQNGKEGFGVFIFIQSKVEFPLRVTVHL